MATPASFNLFSVFFKQSFPFLKKSMWKNVHPIYGAGIWTHDPLIMSLLPYQLDQGSRSNKVFV